MLSNIIALCIILTLFNVIKLDNMKVGALLLILAFFYDIFWVFYSSKIFGTSVMESVATTVDLPMKFIFPSLRELPIPRCSLIGLGDLALPGIFIAYCNRFGKEY